MTGAVYANIFDKDDEPNEPIDENLPVIKGVHFNKSTIDWAVPYHLDFIDYLDKAADPKNFDPVFALKINSKEAN